MTEYLKGFEPKPSAFNSETAKIMTSFQGISTVMDWNNTHIYTFTEGAGTYDHVQHKLPDGRCVAFHLDEAWNEVLSQRGFKKNMQAEVDPDTMAWYLSTLEDQFAGNGTSSI